MTTFTTRCRRCGAAFEPTPDRVRAGAWRTCPACAVPPEEHQRCRECGRVLKGTARSVCYGCLTGGGL